MKPCEMFCTLNDKDPPFNLEGFFKSKVVANFYLKQFKNPPGKIVRVLVTPCEEGPWFAWWDSEKEYFPHIWKTEATDFFESRIFWDSKRPITASLLNSLCLQTLSETLNSNDPGNNIIPPKVTDP